MMKISDGSLHLTADCLAYVISTDNAGDHSYQIAGANLSIGSPISLKYIRSLLHLLQIASAS